MEQNLQLPISIPKQVTIETKVNYSYVCIKLTCSIAVFRVLMAQMETQETQEHQDTLYVATC